MNIYLPSLSNAIKSSESNNKFMRIMENRNNSSHNKHKAYDASSVKIREL